MFWFFKQASKYFYFPWKKNQTNFGGVLFLIYIIIMILISAAYIYDYKENDKYIYEGMIFQNKTDEPDR